MSEIRVLLVDASAEDLAWVRVLTETASEIALHWESSLDRALADLPVDEFDLVLLDDEAGTRDGAELVRQLRGQEWTRPAIVLASRHDEAAAVRALRAGADDYILKQQITPSGFVRAVRHAVERDRAAAKIALQSRMLDEAEQRLRAAQKLEAVGQLAGGVAHDFNNLLTAIRGYGDIVRSALPSTDPLQHELSELLGATDRAAALTQQLLAFSRRQVLKPRWLDMGTLVTDMEQRLRRLVKGTRSLELRAAVALPRISADRAQLEQVIVQLVENACDATPEGGTVTLALDAVTLDAAFVSSHGGGRPGRWLRVSVMDTGQGMSPAVRARLFEPFFTTKDMGEGLGLGLSTAYGIVHQSGGFMDVRSAEGGGSRFDVYLPVSPEPEARRQTPAAAPAVDGGRVLVVEDSAPVRAVVVRTLRKAGFDVLEAADGAEGFAAATAADVRLRLVVADSQMPHLSGWDLATQLRARADAPPILIMSGDTPESLGIARMPDGVHFIGKPFSGSALIERVRAILDRASADAGEHTTQGERS
jgi:signal transduction histidine kinase